MNLFTLFLIGLSVILFEAFFVDPAYWRSGKSDKPISTIIRVLMTIVFMILFGAEIGLVVLGSYCFFDFIIGLKKHGDIFYLGEGKWDQAIKNIPKYLNVFFRVVLAAFFWGGFFYIDRGNTVFNPIVDWLNNLL